MTFEVADDRNTGLLNPVKLIASKYSTDFKSLLLLLLPLLLLNLCLRKTHF